MTDRHNRHVWQPRLGHGLSRDGERNQMLTRHAFFLGKLVRDGAISEAEVTDRLTSAAITAGLDRIEIRDTIQSGLRSGGN